MTRNHPTIGIFEIGSRRIGSVSSLTLLVFVCIAILVTTFPAQAQLASDSAWPPIAVNELEQNVQIAVPAGVSGRIAFSIHIADKDRIVSLDLDAKRLQPLVSGPGNSTYPAWSPDGRSLVFASDRDGKRQIYTTNWQGSDERRISKDLNSDDLPAWSSDGTKIAYHSEEKSGGDSNIKGFLFKRDQFSAEVFGLNLSSV